MISLKRTVVIASVLIAAVYTPIASSTVVFVADIGDGPTQTGFSAFPLGFGRSGTGPITHSFGSTMLTIDATVDHQLEHRDRGVLGALVLSPNPIFFATLQSRKTETLNGR